ncbi:hypothetical protein TWF481_009128 [Arthrobotrys musiformis]|uniref:Uncharacterized protein n=1 Tax=Arthrobotrys musiformis TaxID=47236 RepID=A0AAV9W4Q7_9PEZI
MLFSNLLVVLSAAAATASVEKRTSLEDNFKLQVQGGPLDGKWVAGAYDTSGAFLDDKIDDLEFSLLAGTLTGAVGVPDGGPGTFGFPDLAFIYFETYQSSEITGCSINVLTSILTGCTSTFDSNTYDTFGAAANKPSTELQWAFGNSTTD